MQTSSLIRPSYQYHHDYGRLDDCAQLRQFGHEPDSNDHSQHHSNNYHHHHQQQQHHPQFIQLSSSGGIYGDDLQTNHITCYQGQQAAPLLDQQQHMVVYSSQESATPAIESYQQVQLDTTTSTTDHHQHHHHHRAPPAAAENANVAEIHSAYSLTGLSNFDYQSPVGGERAIYYDSAAGVSYGASEAIGSATASEHSDGRILRQQDQPLFCESMPSNGSCQIEAIPSQPPPEPIYFQYNHQTAISEQPNVENHPGDDDHQTYGENCTPIEQQVYQNLETVSKQASVSSCNDDEQTRLNRATDSNVQNSIVDETEQTNFNYNSNCFTGAGLNYTELLDSNNANSVNFHGCHESHSSAASTMSDSSEESSNSTLTRDEKRARDANIPMSYHEIVNLSIDQFNEQLARHDLTESQLTLIKDIRRRGKNKVAAQSCRKRKMEQIYELQHEVNNLASKRMSLSHECDQLIKEHDKLVQEYNKIYALVQERLQRSSQQQVLGGPNYLNC